MGIREEPKIREEFIENPNSLSKILIRAPKDKWIILTRKDDFFQILRNDSDGEKIITYEKQEDAEIAAKILTNNSDNLGGLGIYIAREVYMRYIASDKELKLK